MSPNETLVVDAEIIDPDLPTFKEPWKTRKKRPRKKRGNRYKDFPKFGQKKIREAIIASAAMGAPNDVAANLAGVTPGTLSRWLTRGEEIEARRDTGENIQGIDAEFANFFVDFHKAQASPIMVALGAFMTGVQNDPKLASDYLKTVGAKHFGTQKQIIEHQGDIKHIHGFDEKLLDNYKQLTTEQLREAKRVAIMVKEVKELPPGTEVIDEDD